MDAVYLDPADTEAAEPQAPSRSAAPATSAAASEKSGDVSDAPSLPPQT
jgi:hypothetical protein